VHKRVSVLIDESQGPAGNAWAIEFRQGLFNMTSDSDLFRTARQLQEAGFVHDGGGWTMPQGVGPRQGTLSLAEDGDELSLALHGGALHCKAERYVPLYEAKMVHQFDHRWATYEGVDSRDTTRIEKSDREFEPTPRY